MPRRAAPSAASAAKAAPNTGRHRHHIDVETDEPEVHVSIGQRPAAAVPGGFAKFFNRVIDNGLWSQMPDAARTVYLPLVRLADGSGRGPMRARCGLAGLIKHTGLSRSSVKRGLRALQDLRLIVVVSQGGVGADGVNRTNVYELLVPEPADVTSVTSAPTGSVQQRTPSRSKAEPAAGPTAATPPGQRQAGTGATGRPLLRGSSQTHNPEASGGQVAAPGESTEADALAERFAAFESDAGDNGRLVAMLGRWGIGESDASRHLATFGRPAVIKALDDARDLHAKGKLRSPSGFIAWRLNELAPAEKPAPEPAAPVAPPTADGDIIDELADDVLDRLAASVRARYAADASMIRLLTKKPPRQSPLMRAEVEALLKG